MRTPSISSSAGRDSSRSAAITVTAVAARRQPPADLEGVDLGAAHVRVEAGRRVQQVQWLSAHTAPSTAQTAGSDLSPERSTRCDRHPVRDD